MTLTRRGYEKSGRFECLWSRFAARVGACKHTVYDARFFLSKGYMVECERRFASMHYDLQCNGLPFSFPVKER